jgi:GNAT superfamily N-acetyltransferase
MTSQVHGHAGNSFQYFTMNLAVPLGQWRSRLRIEYTWVAMSATLTVRPAERTDFKSWMPLWEGYNAFYGRQGETALDPNITERTWQRFFDANEPVFALVAESGENLVGLTHYLFHRDTTRIELTCYLQDLFTAPSLRGRGIGRSLILGVYKEARAAGIKSVYWQTHESNAAGRLLYEQVAKHLGFLVYEHEL